MTPQEAINHGKEQLEIFGGEHREFIEMAIKALEQEPCEKCEVGNPCLYCEYDFTEKKTKESCEDCISREAVKEMLTEEWTKYMPIESDVSLSFVLEKISELPSVTPKTRWIPVKWHEITDEERVIEEYPNEWLVHLDCQMPDDGERILVQTKWGNIELDECYIDDGCYLDSGYDWVDDIIAWMPLPQPYAESEDK